MGCIFLDVYKGGGGGKEHRLLAEMREDVREGEAEG
jgi:hypothetical protein